MQSKTVTVIISTYNGEINIIRQIESILQQKGVIVSVYIRDDQSSDNTVETIRNYIRDNNINNMQLVIGKNKGYAKSFWLALCSCRESEYYAFSDQDDVWEKDKLIKCIRESEKDDLNIPKLTYCKMQRSDPALHRLSEQVSVLKPEELTKKLVLTKTYNYGAATVINAKARELVCRCWPDIPDLPHDMWVGIICYWFGKVYYVDEELYYWIRYESSVTGAGTRWSGFEFRLKQSLKGNSYPNTSKYLLEAYGELIAKDDKEFLLMLMNYKKNNKYKWKLILDKEFNRNSIKGTIALKVGVILGWL